MADEKTNVTRLLQQKNIPHRVYSCGQPLPADGGEMARRIGKPPEQVFKTLVTLGASGGHYVFVVPVARSLSLKAAAKAVGEKSIRMIPQAQLLPLTGYIHGGCSPVGMKKHFPTVIDQSAQELETMCCSAGKVGVQIELPPGDLADLTSALFAPVAE